MGKAKEQTQLEKGLKDFFSKHNATDYFTLSVLKTVDGMMFSRIKETEHSVGLVNMIYWWLQNDEWARGVCAEVIKAIEEEEAEKESAITH